MKLSRRDFVLTTATGAAGLCFGAFPTNMAGAEVSTPPTDEDGYKLWLRYAPPGSSAKNYRKIVQQIRVGGTSPTSHVIREEFRIATASMFGSAVPTDENTLAA